MLSTLFIGIDGLVEQTAIIFRANRCRCTVLNIFVAHCLRQVITSTGFFGTDLKLIPEIYEELGDVSVARC